MGTIGRRIILECCECQHCSSVADWNESMRMNILLGVTDSLLPETDEDALVDFIQEESPSVDCPICGENVCLSDCTLV